MKGWIMLLTQLRLSNRSQDLVVIVMVNIKREVPINPFQGAWADQAAGATGANAPVYRVFREMLDDVVGATAGKLRLRVPSRVPHARDMLKPQVPRFHIDGTLPNVMLHIRILDL